MTDEMTATQALLAALAEAGGFDVPAPEEDGRYLLELDDGLGVALMPTTDEDGEPEALAVTFVLGELKVTTAAVLKDLLAANYMGAFSAGGAFAVEDESGQVVLQRAFPLSVGPDVFVEAFGQLAGAAREYRDRLSGGEAVADIRFMA